MTNYCLKIIKYIFFIFLISSTISCNYFNRGLGFDYVNDDDNKPSYPLENKQDKISVAVDLLLPEWCSNGADTYLGNRQCPRWSRDDV